MSELTHSRFGGFLGRAPNRATRISTGVTSRPSGGRSCDARSIQGQDTFGAHALDPALKGEVCRALIKPAQPRVGHLVVQLNDKKNVVIGGLWGHTAYGWLFTQFLFVPDSLRGNGLGTQLMQLAESESIARGCHGSWLDTFEFQARAFYEGIGHVCFGELPNYPTGFTRFFLKKELVGVAP